VFQDVLILASVVDSDIPVSTPAVLKVYYWTDFFQFSCILMLVVFANASIYYLASYTQIWVF